MADQAGGRVPAGQRYLWATFGASFKALPLVGSLWRQPMWDPWWVWGARLTFELNLLFLCLGSLAIYNAIDDIKAASRTCAALTLVAVVDIPIIHYSVKWWNTLHQSASLTFSSSSIAMSMLIPLLVVSLVFMILYAAVVLMRMRNDILCRELHTRSVAKVV